MDNLEDQKIIISLEEYQLLKLDSIILEILTERGVDNWDGSSGVIKLAAERFEKEFDNA